MIDKNDFSTIYRYAYNGIDVLCSDLPGRVIFIHMYENEDGIIGRIKTKKMENPKFKNLSFSDLSLANVKRCSHFTSPNKKGGNIQDYDPLFWSTALAGEVGEACNIIKKMVFGQEGVTVEHLADELADIVIYADLLAQRYKIALDAAVKNKFNKTSDRINSPVKL